MEGRKLRSIAAVATGAAFGILTVVILGSGAGEALHSFVFPLYPGLFVAMIGGGAALSASLGLIILGNVGFYFVAGWLLAALWERHFHQ
jgi:hypothetical protein